MVETDIDPAIAVPIGILMVTAAYFATTTGWWERHVAESWPPYGRAWEHADHDRSARVHKWVFGVGTVLYPLGMGGVMLIASAGGIVELLLAPVLVVGGLSMPVVVVAGAVSQIQIARKDLWAKPPDRRTRSYGYRERQETMTLDERLRLLREELDEEIRE